LGFDKNGYVLHVHDVGKVDPRSLVGSGRVSELCIAAIYDCEGTQCLMRSEEAKRGRKLGAVVIIDLSGFSFDVIFHIPATRIYTTALMLMQDLFPDTAIRLYVVNAPLAVNVLLHMVKMETLEALEILGSDWKEVLVKRHGAECLPKSCGGLKSDEILRKGGVVPDLVKAQIKRVHIPAEKLTKVTVGAREIIAVPIKVQKQHSKLSWYFTCSSGDIDFSVVFEEQEVWPRFRISTEFSPEFNEIVCKKPGTYELLFSNKHGRLWNKHIYYSIEVSEPMN
uniref:CRAL-TRIO domain-containing protein n=1 Tax=Gongylonema pulchrum TaxID=637853 RepID=A0A183CWR5_9BILA